MKQLYLIKEHNPSLLLFFAGWGMDENPFKEYHPAGCDFVICYDYRSLDFDYALLYNYSSVRLVAWSMGVWAASQVFHNKQELIAESIAINGTRFPVDDEKGISRSIFKGTLEGLNEASLQKFFRRMCGTPDALTLFTDKIPCRPLEDVKEELKHIGEQAAISPDSSFCWDKVIIGTKDKIFLPGNQQRAWGDAVCTEQHDMEHYSETCFKKILGWIKN